MWIALAAAAAITVAPQPSATPLKTITNVHSTPFCTALRDNVGQAVKALIENNAAFGDAKSVFLQMAHDKVFSAARNSKLDMDMDRLGPVIDRVSRNLADSQAQLDRLSRISFSAQSQDGRLLDQMEVQLRAIVQHQNRALNILSGTFYSYNGNELLHHKDKPLDSDDTKDATPIVLPPLKPTPTAGSSPKPDATLDPARPQSQDLGLLGNTKYAALFNDLTTYQLEEMPLESDAAHSILSSAARCNGGP